MSPGSLVRTKSAGAVTADELDDILLVVAYELSP
jgi:hypothetical protein